MDVNPTIGKVTPPYKTPGSSGSPGSTRSDPLFSRRSASTLGQLPSPLAWPQDRLVQRQRKSGGTFSKSSKVAKQSKVSVVEPRGLLPYVNNALDIAEEYFGANASLADVSVVQGGPKGSNMSSDDLSDDTDANLPYEHRKKPAKKKSSVVNFFKRSNISGTTGKEATQQAILFKFLDPSHPKNQPLPKPESQQDGAGEPGHPDMDEAMNDYLDGNSVFTLDSMADSEATVVPPGRCETEDGNASEVWKVPKISVTSMAEDSMDEISEVTTTTSSNPFQIHYEQQKKANDPRITIQQSRQTLDRVSSVRSFQGNTISSMQNESSFLGLQQHLNDENLETRSIRSIRNYVSMGGGVSLDIEDKATSSSSVTTKKLPGIQPNQKLSKKDLLARYWDKWTFITSIIYALFLVVLGVVIYSLDVFVRDDGAKVTKTSSAYFNMFLCIVGTIWLVWLMVDINKYIASMKEHWKNCGSVPDIKLVEGQDGELLISIPIASCPEKIPQYYCFSTERHSGSFFLKIGAAVFCVGHMVNIGVNIAKEAAIINNSGLEYCGSKETLAYLVFQAMYAGLQLFMIFKHSNVIVNRSKGLARFAFMHCIASSICFWMDIIVLETLDSLVAKLIDNDPGCVHNDTRGLLSWSEKSSAGNQSINASYKCPNQSLACIDDGPMFSLDIDCKLAKMCECNYENHISDTVFTIAPYLYPFSIEFSIIVVGVWYIMWDNIGKVEENRENMEFLPNRRGSSASSEFPSTNTSSYIFADCQSANKGLLAGLSVIVVTAIGLIVFAILSSSPKCDDREAGGVFHDVLESLVISLMLMATVWVYYKISLLDVNPNPISFLDDMLLIVCLPSSFLYSIICLLPAFLLDSVDASVFGSVITSILRMLQVMVQTPMLVDGLRRCADGLENQRRKPGKNLVTFLIVANIAMYVWETMEAKTKGTYLEARKEFYGASLWTVFSHITLPLSIFYRFHSAVALADIWSTAYRPGDHH